MTESAKLSRFIRNEIINDIKINPFHLAEKLVGTGVSTEEMVQVATEVSRTQSNYIRSSCYIFGDTYDDQPVEKTLSILTDSGFQVSETSLETDGIELYHDLYDMSVLVLVQDGLTVRILLNGSYEVSAVDLDELFNIGLITADLVGNVLSFHADFTLGFSSKFLILKSFASS